MSENFNFKEIALPEFAELATSQSIYRLYGKEVLEVPRGIILKSLLYASIPIIALDGEDCSFPDRDSFINFLMTTPAGVTLSAQACHARKSRKKWTRFCHSIRQPGFVFAWFVFASTIPIENNQSVSDSVKQLRREHANPLDALTRWLAEKARETIPLPGTSDFEEFVTEQARLSDSIRRKQTRNKTAKMESPYRIIAESDFLANALWCRSTSDIVSEYFPGSNVDEHVKHEAKFNKAFSLLKLVKARRFEIPQCPDIKE